MRILAYLIASVLFFSCSSKTPDLPPPTPVDTLATGWKKITLPGTGYGDIFFINNTTGFVGGGRDIYKSTDGGNNWQKVFQVTPVLTNIAMGSESNAIFIPGYNQIYLTKNGGVSFDSVSFNDVIFDAYFVNATTVYAIGAKFWKSTDAGSTWTPIYNLSTGSGGYRSLHFLNEQYGWISHPGGPSKTTNGGVSWELKTDPIFTSSTGNVFFTDINNGYTSDGFVIGKTTNGGNNWNRVFTGTTAYQDIHFVTTNIGYTADGSTIYKTVDGGNTWTKEVVLPGQLIIELHFTDASHGWACGTNGVLVYQN